MTKVRRFYALDDCGTRINPMIIEGQIHGGLTEAFGIAMGQEIRYDERATSPARPSWTTSCRPRSRRRNGRPTGRRRPSPHHPIGAKGVGESPNVGGVPCFANAVNDAFKFLGSTHIAMPHDHWRTWMAAESWGCTDDESCDGICRRGPGHRSYSLPWTAALGGTIGCAASVPLATPMTRS